MEPVSSGWGTLVTMDEEVREMLARLKFSDEEARKIFTLNSSSTEANEWEAWAVRMLLTKEKVNKEVMYKVLCSLWFTNELVNFMEVGVRCFLVKFGSVEDRDRILNLASWLLDQHILALVPCVRDKE